MKKIIISKTAFDNVLELVGCVYHLLLFHEIQINTFYLSPEMVERHLRERGDSLVKTSSVYNYKVSIDMAEYTHVIWKGRKILIEVI
jgi:hypothetical protein